MTQKYVSDKNLDSRHEMCHPWRTFEKRQLTFEDILVSNYFKTKRT